MYFRSKSICYFDFNNNIVMSLNHSFSSLNALLLINTFVGNIGKFIFTQVQRPSRNRSVDLRVHRPGPKRCYRPYKNKIAPGDFREKTKNWNSGFDKTSIL